jgi:hypothetical protein
MDSVPQALRRPSGVVLCAALFTSTLILRVWGITGHFWMLGDQIRDWGIALGPFHELPLVGPPTHFRGYTIGPAFYWILWAIRVTFGPLFDNLPHAGGIGQATLQSAADTLLLAAVWVRTRSIWMALATVILLATSAYDLCLAPLVWNPVMGSILAKAATALVLLDWHRRSLVRTGLTAALAWSAVHAYTGAVYVASSLFAALIVEPLIRREWADVRRRAAVVLLTVGLLQIPYLVHQFSSRFSDPAMGVVTGSLTRVLTGSDPPQIAKSVAGYVAAFSFIQGLPDRIPAAGWLLVASGGVLAFRYRRDPLLLVAALLPQALAIVGYALFLGDLDHYYYLSLMPAAVITVVLAAGTWTSQPLARTAGIILVAAALGVAPARMRASAVLHKMPEYAALVEGSRTLARLHQPMRAIETEFVLPPTSDASFLYTILGGRLDRSSPWIGRISATGDVSYRRVEDGSGL